MILIKLKVQSDEQTHGPGTKHDHFCETRMTFQRFWGKEIRQFTKYCALVVLSYLYLVARFEKIDAKCYPSRGSRKNNFKIFQYKFRCRLRLYEAIQMLRKGVLSNINTRGDVQHALSKMVVLEVL